MRAAQALKERGVEAHFLIMGFPGVDSHRELAKSLNTADTITFTGKIPYEEAPAHLALGDIAVAPKLSTPRGPARS